MSIDTLLKIIDTATSLCLVIFASLALSAWKKEIRGKDKYRLAKEILSYTRQLRFIIHSKSGSLYQIYINDILTDRKKFYKDQLIMIGNEKAYFDQSIWGLFGHINTRADILLPKEIRQLLEEICPNTSKIVGSKNEYTYVQLFGVKAAKIGKVREQDGGEKDNHENTVHQINKQENLTIKEYFQRWEKLIVKLDKFV
jgi:hypothetical protein